MDVEHRPRIIVSVSPRLLQDILVRVLGSTGVDDVHDLRNRGRRAMFDAAVVTGPMPEGVDARLVMQLSLEDDKPTPEPDTEEVAVDDFAQVLATLDQAYPSPQGDRISWLVQHTRSSRS